MTIPDADDPCRDLHNRTSRDLLRMYAASLTILIARGVVRTRNAPAGDLAERLVANAYRGTLAPNSEKSYDVLAEDGRRIQVKCRVLAAAKGSQTYSVFRSWSFDTCVFVRLDPVTYDVLEAWEVPVSAVCAKAKEVRWVRGSRVSVAMHFASIPGAVKVTGRLQAALEELPDVVPGRSRMNGPIPREPAIRALIDVTPQALSTAGLVALDAAAARELARRGLGTRWSEAVGRYAGVLVARALGGHVASSHPRGAEIMTMSHELVRVRVHFGRQPARYTRSDFHELLTDGVAVAIHLHLHEQTAEVMRGIKVTREEFDAADPTSRHIDGLDITSWLVDSANTLESLRGQRASGDTHGLGQLTTHERERIYAIDRIYFEGSNWLADVSRLKIYPYRKDD